KEEFVAVRKNDDGDLIAFKTNTGRELDYVSALDEAKAGNIAHIDVFHKYGRDIIRSEPDGIKENNLDQLPSFRVVIHNKICLDPDTGIGRFSIGMTGIEPATSCTPCMRATKLRYITVTF